MKTTGRHQLRHRLPRGYFADAPLSHFEAADSATSAGQKGTTPTARADTHAAASTIAPPSGDDRSADLISRRDGGASLPKLEAGAKVDLSIMPRTGGVA